MTRSVRAQSIWVVGALLAYLALTFGFVFSLSVTTLLVWEIVTVVLLTVGFLVLRRRVNRDLPDPPRDSLFSQLMAAVLPFAASGVGIVSVGLILYSQSLGDTVAASDQLVIRVVCAAGVVLSWMMLQVGFAQVYVTAYDRDPADPGFLFPETPDPALIDFIYFSFTIGVSFAVSDVNVTSRRVRLILLVHSVVGFLYNAIVVAMAFQVLQSLGGG